MPRKRVWVSYKEYGCYNIAYQLDIDYSISINTTKRTATVTIDHVYFDPMYADGWWGYKWFFVGCTIAKSGEDPNSTTHINFEGYPNWGSGYGEIPREEKTKTTTSRTISFNDDGTIDQYYLYWAAWTDVNAVLCPGSTGRNGYSQYERYYHNYTFTRKGTGDNQTYGNTGDVLKLNISSIDPVYKIYYKASSGSVTSPYSLDSDGFICKSGSRYHDSVSGSTSPSSPSKFGLSRTGYTSSSEWDVEGNDTTVTSGTEYSVKEWGKLANSNKNIVLIAKWVANNYSITLSKKTGIKSVSGGGTYAYGTKITISAECEDGYHWSKWDDNNTKQKRSITVTGNASYTAIASPNTYTVNFEPGIGGTGSMSSITKNYGASFNLPDVVFSRTSTLTFTDPEHGTEILPLTLSHDFNKWMPGSYKNKELVSNLTVDTAITLTANWKSLTYSLKDRVLSDSSNNLVFKGWSDGVAVYTDTYTVSGSSTGQELTAVWEPVVKPRIVGNITVSNITATSFNFSATGNSKICWYYKISGVNNDFQKIGEGECITNVVVSGLTPNTSYKLTVKAQSPFSSNSPDVKDVTISTSKFSELRTSSCFGTDLSALYLYSNVYDKNNFTYKVKLSHGSSSMTFDLKDESGTLIKDCSNVILDFSLTQYSSIRQTLLNWTSTLTGNKSSDSIEVTLITYYNNTYIGSSKQHILPEFKNLCPYLDATKIVVSENNSKISSISTGQELSFFTQRSKIKFSFQSGFYTCYEGASLKKIELRIVGSESSSTSTNYMSITPSSSLDDIILIPDTALSIAFIQIKITDSRNLNSKEGWKTLISTSVVDYSSPKIDESSVSILRKYGESGFSIYFSGKFSILPRAAWERSTTTIDNTNSFRILNAQQVDSLETNININNYIKNIGIQYKSTSSNQYVSASLLVGTGSAKPGVITAFKSTGGFTGEFYTSASVVVDEKMLTEDSYNIIVSIKDYMMEDSESAVVAYTTDVPSMTPIFSKQKSKITLTEDTYKVIPKFGFNQKSEISEDSSGTFNFNTESDDEYGFLIDNLDLRITDSQYHNLLDMICPCLIYYKADSGTTFSESSYSVQNGYVYNGTEEVTTSVGSGKTTVASIPFTNTDYSWICKGVTISKSGKKSEADWKKLVNGDNIVELTAVF